MAQLVCRRMNVGDEAPAQPRPHPLFQPLQIRRGLVGGDDDLPVLVDQRVEGVEELLLRALAPADELHVVDHQDVNRAELLLERSEEHTSELQSLMRISYAVFCLKKKN